MSFSECSWLLKDKNCLMSSPKHLPPIPTHLPVTFLSQKYLEEPSQLNWALKEGWEFARQRRFAVLAVKWFLLGPYVV